MKCTQFEEQLSSYIDGELAAEERTHLEAHLAQCGSCRHALARIRHTAGLVQSLGEVPAPAELRARVFAQIGAACPVAAMACAEASDNLHCYLDGELTATEVQRLEAHLVGCASCARELSTIRRTISAVGGLPQVVPPQRIWQRVAEQTARRSPWSLHRWVWGATGAAALVSLLFAVFSMTHLPMGQQAARQTSPRKAAPVAHGSPVISSTEVSQTRQEPDIATSSVPSAISQPTVRHQRRVVRLAEAKSARRTEPVSLYGLATSARASEAPVAAAPAATAEPASPQPAEEPKAVATNPVIPDDAVLSDGSLAEPVAVAEAPKPAAVQPRQASKPRNNRITVESHPKLEVVRLPDRAWRVRSGGKAPQAARSDPGEPLVAVWSKRH